MSQAMTIAQIPLGDLDLHEKNVRSSSPETYEAENIAHLKASIAALGLIQPLVVQKQDKGHGVLAGGRRLAALKALAADKSAKGVTLKTRIECRLIPEDCDARTAISLAENITQAPMSPIDQYEAFAGMMEVDGQSVETIAMTFGTTTAAVKERLRYGLVHEDIRAAVRAKTLTLDAMKAFADHPSQEVQLDVYKAVTREDDRPGAYQIRKALKERGVQVSDALGAFVREDYEAKGGRVAADLLEDNSVLENLSLVEEVLIDKLRAAAEAERARLGFAWADAAPAHSWDMFAEYGRVYPGPIEVDETAKTRLDAIAAEVSSLEDQAETGEMDEDALDALYERIEALGAQADALQSAYAPEDLARAGVFATWNGNVQLTVGLVRPEDKTSAKGAGADTGTGEAAPADDGQISYAASLEADLKTERGLALGAALAMAPEVGADLAMFKIVCDVLLDGSSVTQGFDIRASQTYPVHAKLDDIDPAPIQVMTEAHDALALGWADGQRTSVQMFAGFRALEPGEKAKLVAYAVGKSTNPCFAREGQSEPLMGAIEAEIMPDIRVFWRPNAAFFGRLKKAQLLRVLSEDLGLAQEALSLSGSKKNDVVDFLDQLFAEPFATLTPEQRAAVDAWCPPGMQTTPAQIAAPAKPKARAKGKSAKVAAPKAGARHPETAQAQAA